ncbi:uncharacterized protein [Diabrotica undecimpunctata]|uniref:uncharacterized protein isoform X1 n=1 Tax=Diabrotica undecimpunctata TaxID=50387 RepID=UPI003B6359CF
MKYLLYTVIFISTIALSSAVDLLCDFKWPRCGLTVENTVCNRDEKCQPEPGCEDVQPDPEFLKFILHEHNRLRKNVASGAESRGFTGVAANMMAISYDKDLEYTARCHINRCKFEHDKCRGTKKFPLAGQNLYYTSESQEALKNAVNEWYEEINQMTPDVIDSFPRGREDVERFTHIIWAKTTHIGCASSKSDDGKHYLACNYGPKGNDYGKMVFDRGTPASKCGLFVKPNPFYPALCGVINQSMLGVGRGGSGGNQTDDGTETNSTSIAPVAGIKDLSNIGLPPVVAVETKTTEKDDSGGGLIGGVGFGGFGFGGLPPGVPGAPGVQGPQNNNNNEKKKTKKPDKTTVTLSTTNTTIMNSTTPLNTTYTTPLTTNTTPVTTTKLTTPKPIVLPTVQLPIPNINITKPKKPTRRISRGSMRAGSTTKWYVLFCFVFLMIGFWFFMCRRSVHP